MTTNFYILIDVYYIVVAKDLLKTSYTKYNPSRYSDIDISPTKVLQSQNMEKIDPLTQNAR